MIQDISTVILIEILKVERIDFFTLTNLKGISHLPKYV